jgi:AraC-like DNA-binding protein
MDKSFQFNSVERTDFSNFNCHYSKNQSIGAHSHQDYYEITITLGDYFEVVGKENFSRKIKDVTILKPNISHAINIKSENSCHYNIAVRKKYFETFIENKTALKNYFKSNGYLSFTLSDETFNYVSAIINKINNTKYDYLSLTIVESVLYAIVADVLPTLIKKETLSDKLCDYALDAIEKINDGTFIEKTPKNVYELYPLSHTTFIKTFKEITGKTPSDYLLDKKLEYAKKLLLTTSDSVLEISLKIGFESVSHFIKIFKIKYGITPLKLRKIDLNNKNPEIIK